jgi:glycerol uptake facilitator-like aquaporin
MFSKKTIEHIQLVLIEATLITLFAYLFREYHRESDLESFDPSLSPLSSLTTSTPSDNINKTFKQIIYEPLIAIFLFAFGALFLFDNYSKLISDNIRIGFGYMIGSALFANVILLYSKGNKAPKNTSTR